MGSSTLVESCGSGPAITLKSNAVFDQNGRCPSGFQKREVAAVGEESDLPGLGVFDSGDAADFGIGWAFEAASQLVGDFGKFHGRGS